jgi:hypothetical protein
MSGGIGLSAALADKAMTAATTAKAHLHNGIPRRFLSIRLRNMTDMAGDLYSFRRDDS